MGAREPIIIDKKPEDKKPRFRADAAAGWRAAAWLGAALALVGAMDAALALLPASFGVPEWEFGAIASSLGSLPVLSIGLGALLASFLARGQRLGAYSVASILVLLAVILAALYVIFLLTLPLALKSAPQPALLAIKKTAIKASVLGVVFPLGFLAAGVSAIRSIRRSSVAR